MPEPTYRPPTRDRHFNRQLGWLLIALGFLGAAMLDPWDLGVAATDLSLRLAVRQAEGVVLGMGLFQLLVSTLLSADAAGRWVGRLTAAGAVLYAAGHVSRLVFPALGWLVPLGALLNLVGGALLFRSQTRPGATLPVRLALGAVVLGMGLDAGAGLLALFPGGLEAQLGPADGVRMRMLRLARVAALALPAQAILYQQLRREGPEPRVIRWGALALGWGAVGMPLVLAAAALGDLRLKYLLPLPADLVLFGAGVAVWLTFRGGDRLERVAWSLLLGSMLVGQGMGGFAFAGPLPAPAGFGQYQEFVRSLVRTGHAYAILLALLVLFAHWHRSNSRPKGLRLLLTGTVVTLGAMVLAAVRVLPPVGLALGPVLIALAALLLAVEKVPE